MCFLVPGGLLVERNVSCRRTGGFLCLLSFTKGRPQVLKITIQIYQYQIVNRAREMTAFMRLLELSRLKMGCLQ